MKKYDVNPEEFNTHDLLIMGMSLMDSRMSFSDNQLRKKAELAKARKEINAGITKDENLFTRLKNLRKSKNELERDVKNAEKEKKVKLTEIEFMDEELSTDFSKQFKQMLSRFKYLCVIK